MIGNDDFVFVLEVVGVFCMIVLFLVVFVLLDSFTEKLRRCEMIKIFLDEKLIYEGKDFYADWKQLGEIGNKYQVIIYKRRIPIDIQSKVFVGDNFRVDSVGR